jgi:hypothetical protein
MSTPAPQPEPGTPAPRRYRWPWYLLAFVIGWLAISVLWVTLAARKVAEERDLDAPLPSSAPIK